jgi:ABC-type oligopeptide transport system ATPase subunit
VSNPAPLLDVRGLTRHFPAPGGGRTPVRAVEDVSFAVLPGETFGLVGESGCGKSTVARCILRLLPPTSGQVYFAGRDLLALGPRQLREVRRELQIIFQDPYSSLNPRMTVRKILSEPLEIHRVGTRAQREARVRELLEMVGLPPAALHKFPHEFSGGQRQRIGIARALALSPRLVVADEPVSALDLSIRAQVINLMADLQEQLGLAYLFIAHDLTVVRHVCRRVAVMHRGRIVELAPAAALFGSPRHPYTRRLLEAVPVPDPQRRREHPAQDWPDPPDSTTGVTQLMEETPGHWVRREVDP